MFILVYNYVINKYKLVMDDKGMLLNIYLIKKERQILLKKIPRSTTLKREISHIIILWMYIKNLILNVKTNFDISCRLMKKMARDTFDHHTEELPDWLIDIMSKWYDEIDVKLCNE